MKQGFQDEDFCVYCASPELFAARAFPARRVERGGVKEKKKKKKD